MTDREHLGVVAVGLGWPRICVPNPVIDHYHDLASRLPADVAVHVVGQGYHNAGWSYSEIEIRALSLGTAHEVADRLLGECMMRYQLDREP